MIPMNQTCFIAGHARLPQGMAAKSLYDTLTVTAEIDQKYGVIIEASCTLATELGRNYINRLLRGISLRDGIDKAIQLVQTHYHGRGANALVAAIKDLYIQYEQLNGKKS